MSRTVTESILLFISGLVLVATSNASVSEQCSAKLPDSAEYTGECLDGLFHGKGVLTWRNGSRYVGEFSRGLMHGHGRFEHIAGWTKSGEYKDGVLTGQGVYKSASGDLYTGEYEEGLRDGEGTYEYANGDRYAGEFRKGRKHGDGVYYKNKSGKMIRGVWEMGEYTGVTVDATCEVPSDFDDPDQDSNS